MKEIDIICLGEMLIDFIALQSGKKLIEVESFKKFAGGAPANVAVGVSKLGKLSVFLGRLGDDEFGYFLKDRLEENGVDCSQLQFDEQARTGLAFISLPTPNTREFLFYRNPSADMKLNSDEFDHDFIKNTKIFHFGSITLINEPSKSATLKAIEIVKKSGGIISYDPNLRLNLWKDARTARSEINKVMPLVDIVKVNDEEILFLMGKEDIKKGMSKVLSKGPSLCLVTLGKNGCFYKTKKLFGKFGAFKVETVDSNGCGDSFISSILVKVLENGLKNTISDKDIMLSAIKFASAAAAITSTKRGVISSLPAKSEVEKFLCKNFLYNE